MSAVTGRQSKRPARQACAWPELPVCPNVHPVAVAAEPEVLAKVVFLHGFSPSVYSHGDPVQGAFLVCRGSCCVPPVQALLEARGEVVPDHHGPTRGVMQ